MVDYFLNQMGIYYTQWYIDNGIPCTTETKYSKILEKEIEVITPEYYVAAGRIDIRDDSKEGYDGWGEYAVPPMKQLSWNLLGDWLSDLETEEVVGYYRLIEMFEQQTRHKIEWVKERFGNE